MPRTAMLFGLLLVIQGVGFYLGTAAKSFTALIPALIGLPILVLGLVAFNASARKHAMHLVAVLALVGFLAALGRMVQAGVSLSPAGTSVLLMAVLTGALLVLCIKSFVDARRRRDQPPASVS